MFIGIGTHREAWLAEREGGGVTVLAGRSTNDLGKRRDDSWPVRRLWRGSGYRSFAHSLHSFVSAFGSYLHVHLIVSPHHMDCLRLSEIVSYPRVLSISDLVRLPTVFSSPEQGIVCWFRN